jgi:hypothetical protein
MICQKTKAGRSLAPSNQAPWDQSSLLQQLSGKPPRLLDLSSALVVAPQQDIDPERPLQQHFGTTRTTEAATETGGRPIFYDVGVAAETLAVSRQS